MKGLDSSISEGKKKSIKISFILEDNKKFHKNQNFFFYIFQLIYNLTMFF